MNSKIFVFVAVVALAAALGMILLSGASSIINSPENTNQEIKSDISQEPISAQIQSLNVELNDISIKEVTPRGATIEISFKINNPNSNSVIVQVMDYQLFETGYSNVEQISGGQIGSRPEGMVEFGSDYYVLLAENSIILKDKIQLKNTGNTPKLWSDLESDTAKWRVTGTIFYNLSSITSGQENTLHFEFEK